MSSITVLGDLIGSRVSVDRRALHARFERALEEVNADFSPLTPMRMQVGDEYQAVFATLGDALSASLLVRLALLPDHDIRHGIGRGAVEVLTEDPRIEDGPGWWAARQAIERAAGAEGRPSARSLRTAYVAHDSVSATDEAAVNAALLLRDERVTGLSERSLSVLRGLLSGQSQRDLAEALGISPSAVSQRVRADGLGALVAAHELMRGLA
ncbi:SatD family protein [Nocardioides sp.]|uniref:SatD family protein n=1 Tax=Nocardioides sp. TaxID=35761 RepID=UPI002B7E9157|nr:SatD family protein [Nocardioides sp.]HXH77498.1 SatD family protein [Nocardioides sp.]